MTTHDTPIVLAPVRQHPELAGVDEATLTLFADTLGIDLIRNWDGQLATSTADAWRIREQLDADHLRAAEAAAARLTQAEAEDEIRLGPIRRRQEAERRRQAMKAAIDEMPLPDVPFAAERWRDWEAKVDELGAALFTKPLPAAEVDHRTPVERLKDKQ